LFKKILIIWALVALAPSFACATTAFDTLDGKVKTVYDGASLLLDGVHRLDVVLMGVKNPSLRKPFRDRASKALSQKLHGKMVKVVIYDRVPSKHHYSNTPEYAMVAVVMIGDRNINLEMVSEGLARAEKLGIDKAFDEELVAAELQARKQKKGLWIQKNP
jgi:endonuclease YncB( thermonuclease family)